MCKFDVNGVEIKGGNEGNCVGLQFYWQMHPRREHDKYPETCNDYKNYSIHSDYVPTDDYHSRVTLVKKLMIRE